MPPSQKPMPDQWTISLPSVANLTILGLVDDETLTATPKLTATGRRNGSLLAAPLRQSGRT
ncbi:hypothetical protein [Streptomyces chryseus]